MALTTDKSTPVIKVTGTATTAEEIVSGDLVWVERIYWQNPTTHGHLVAIKDTASGALANFNCYSGSLASNIGFTQERVIRAPFNGIKIDDMDSGTIFIHLGSGR